MKITKLALSAAIAATCLGGSVFAQAPVTPSKTYFGAGSAPADYSAVIPASCACGDAPVSCDAGCSGGCSDGSCDAGGCGLLGGGLFAGGCDSACGGCDSACGGDEPWKLFQNPVAGFDVGGWAQLGWHSYNNSLFNKHADNVNLHQAWLYAEKVADGSNGLGLGGRIDYIYGVDAQDTQAFGIANNHWDNSWDNGIYGHAMPQLYAEVAYGDVSVKVGHFFTLIGYEVVGATGNFFYSHSYTMYNSEPFTHTGAVATYSAGDNLTLYGGYVMGWDSGFEDNGDAFLGGFSYDLSDSVNVTNQLITGRFGEYANNEVGYMLSSIMTTQVSDSLTHVLWVDILDTDGTGRARERETFDVNNYLLYTLSDKLVWGNRLEWYNIDKGVYGVTAGRSDIYAFTTGLNYAASSNLLFRPELRWDWDKDGVAGNELGQSQTTVGADMIMTF
ncbi:MAG: outer membrane beta-barrel protein [Pirellulaceae bacterium]